MNHIAYFFWLAWEALTAGPVLLPGPTVLAFAGLVLAAVSAPMSKDFLRWRSLWLLLPLVIPVAILAYGVAFVYDDSAGEAPAWRGTVIDLLILLNFPLAAVLIWRLPGIRLVVVGWSAVVLWYSVCAGFMAGMSVTGVWL